MSWSWEGFASGAATAAADVGKVGVRYALDSDLLQQKYELENKAVEHRLRTTQQIAGEERQKQVAELDAVEAPIAQQRMLDKANSAYDFTDEETGQKAPIASWDEVSDEDKQAVQADPDVQLTKREQMDAKLMAYYRTGRMDAKELIALATRDEHEQQNWLLKWENIHQRELDRSSREEQKALDRQNSRELKSMVANSNASLNRALLLQSNQFAQQDRSRDILSTEQSIRDVKRTLADVKTVGQKKIDAQEELAGLQSRLQSLQEQRPSGAGMPQVPKSKGLATNDPMGLR